MGSSIQVGDFEVFSLADAEAVAGHLQELFPNVTEAQWDPYRSLYPSLFWRRANWRLGFRPFLIRGLGVQILVDTGPSSSSTDFRLLRSGGLAAELRLAGTHPSEVNLVFLTHLHTDHIGGTVNGSGIPSFPRARYLTHRDGWAWAATPERRYLPEVSGGLVALNERGVIDLLSETTEIVRGVTAFPTPGHAPGHMSVRVESVGKSLLILGDVAVHPCQIAHPEWVYAWDSDPSQATGTRRDVLARCSQTEVIIACGHYPSHGFGVIRRRSFGSVWEPLG